MLHILSQDENDLHTYGINFDTTWVTIHDTAVDGTSPSTPLRLPRRRTPRLSSVLKTANSDPAPISQNSFSMKPATPTIAPGGSGLWWVRRASSSWLCTAITASFRCSTTLSDPVHSGFDNCGFWDADHIVFVEDAGDTLHAQRNALDSAYLFDVTHQLRGGDQPIRILAEGRDASATLDTVFGTAALGFTGAFNNEGDNEITGWHLSDGDPSVLGLLGAKIPRPLNGNGACSLPSSMAITSPGRFSRIPWQSMETDKKTNECYRSVLMNARGSAIRSRLGGANRYTWEMSHCTLCTRSVRTCIWRIDTRADTTDKSRREREMPLPF